MTFRYSLKNSSTFSAVSKAIGSIFYIATFIDSATFTEKGCTYTEMGIGTIGLLSGYSSTIDELLNMLFYHNPLLIPRYLV
jgi:hypothetical protein